MARRSDLAKFVIDVFHLDQPGVRVIQHGQAPRVPQGSDNFALVSILGDSEPVYVKNGYEDLNASQVTHKRESLRVTDVQVDCVGYIGRGSVEDPYDMALRFSLSLQSEAAFSIMGDRSICMVGVPSVSFNRSVDQSYNDYNICHVNFKVSHNFEISSVVEKFLYHQCNQVVPIGGY
jgi:hypothetical protein